MPGAPRRLHSLLIYDDYALGLEARQCVDDHVLSEVVQLRAQLGHRESTRLRQDEQNDDSLGAAVRLRNLLGSSCMGGHSPVSGPGRLPPRRGPND